MYRSAFETCRSSGGLRGRSAPQQNVSENAHSFGQMPFDALLGNAGALRNLAHGKPLDFAHHDGIAMPFGKFAESSLEFAQFLARNNNSIGSGLVDREIEFLKIFDRLKRYNLFVLHTIDEKISSYREDERPGRDRDAVTCGSANLFV